MSSARFDPALPKFLRSDVPENLESTYISIAAERGASSFAHNSAEGHHCAWERKIGSSFFAER
jgi:hypothetical protein